MASPIVTFEPEDAPLAGALFFSVATALPLEDFTELGLFVKGGAAGASAALRLRSSTIIAVDDKVLGKGISRTEVRLNLRKPIDSIPYIIRRMRGSIYQ